MEPKLASLTASALVSSSLFMALIAKLAERGILSDADTRDIYDDALLSLEEAAANAQSNEMRGVYSSAARGIIENPLNNA